MLKLNDREKTIINLDLVTNIKTAYRKLEIAFVTGNTIACIYETNRDTQKDILRIEAFKDMKTGNKNLMR